jgi:predicted DNA-binding transcriptional regulator YafY
MPHKRSDADRRLRQNERFSRLLRLLTLLQGGGRTRIADLARELERSERTVFRDLQVLELAGVPWRVDRETQRYCLQAGWQFPTLQLTPDEIVSQALAASLSRAPGLSVGNGAQSATAKLATKLTADSQRLLADAQQFMQVLNLQMVDHSRSQETIDTIQAALLDHRQLNGLYASPYEDRPVRVKLHPYRLCLIRHAWYLVAKPASEEHPKTYRVARFRSLRSLSDAASVPENWSLEEYLGNAWSVFRGDQPYDIEIRFAKDAAIQVTETRWHATQQERWHKDGSVTLAFRVDGLNEIVWWLLGWTGFATVVKPEELRLMLCEQLKAGIRDNEKD